jgi:hypothetical protein
MQRQRTSAIDRFSRISDIYGGKLVKIFRIPGLRSCRNVNNCRILTLYREIFQDFPRNPASPLLRIGKNREIFQDF